MTYVSNQLVEPKRLTAKSKINLPNGHTSEISSVGNIRLSNDLVLQDVLCVPLFKYNLLSIPKLTNNSNFIVIFCPKFCIIQDYVKMRILGIGREYKGLYILKDKSLEGVDLKLQQIIQHLLAIDRTKLSLAASADSNHKTTSYELWHKRLGHAPYHRIKHVPNLVLQGEGHKVCVTCPMAKFTRLSFPLASNRSPVPCALIHMDIWGPYRVPTFQIQITNSNS